MSIKPTGIEKFICSEWDGWDEVDCGVLMFYNPVILPEIQEILADDRKVESFVVDIQRCIAEFYFGDNDHKTLDFKLQF